MHGIINSIMSGGNYNTGRLRLLKAHAATGVAVFLLFSHLGMGLFSTRAVMAQGDSAAISQGFEATDSIESGALVSIKAGSQNGVELANTSRAPELLGVAGEEALIELTGDTPQVQVVTSGTIPALVSNINGEVKNGDKVTASPISGVGMRTDGGIQVVGTAQADFSTIETSEQQIRDKDGKTQFVRVGLLPVQVNVTYVAIPEEENPNYLPTFLVEIAKSVAGRDVSPVRVLVSAFVMVLGFFSMGVLLYSSVRSSIISIGRNPLSERAVRKSLFQVGATALGILMLTLIAIYLILRA